MISEKSKGFARRAVESLLKMENKIMPICKWNTSEQIEDRKKRLHETFMYSCASLIGFLKDFKEEI